MRWLVRRLLKQGKGAVSYEEDVHFGDTLTIGRAADQAIFLSDLRAALNHARVSAEPGGRYKVESLILAGIRVDGQLTYGIDVGPGATIEIAGTRLTLLEPPRDFDAAVEISTLDKTEQAAEKAKRSKPTSLAQTWIGKRVPSWLLFATILALGLILPALSHFSAPLSAFLAHSPLPTTRSWNPGPLDAAHRFFGDDCKQCHPRAFLTVRDESCLACHATIAAHADPGTFNLPALGEARCASCHQDHLGPAGMVRTDQRLCGDCHTELPARTQNASRLGDATDFGTNHPPFRVRLPAWDANGAFAPQVAVPTAQTRENSGLKFNHEKHLKPDLNTPQGRKSLTCASCHTPDAGGLAMQPIAFETMCHSCHTLGFDTFAPGREVPHAKVAEVSFMLDEFYARRALEGGVEDREAPGFVQTRRRPGDPPLSRQEQAEALTWARDKARKVADSVFTGRACVTCHSVTPPQADQGYRIAPVRVAGIWYDTARFSHNKHETMGCKDCHAAATSQQASDLLIPDIANCRQCHAGAHGGSKVASTCIDCHAYHQSPTLKLKSL